MMFSVKNLFKRVVPKPFERTPKVDNGIAFQDVSMALKKEPKASFPILFQALIVFLGTVGAMYTFITFFNINHSAPTLLICGGVFSLLFTIVYSLKGYVKFSLPFLTLLFVACIVVFREQFAFGFHLVKNVVISGINQSMNYSFPVETLVYNNDYAMQISIFLMILQFFLTALVGFAVVHRPNVFVVLLLTFPLFEIGMFFGIVPNYLPLAMLLACWTAVLAMQMASSKFLLRKSKLQFEQTSKKELIYVKSDTRRSMILGAGVLLAITTLVVFGGTSFILNETNFTRPPEVDVLRADIKDQIDQIIYKEGDGDDNAAGINEGRLNRVKKREVRDVTHLEVELPFSEKGIYLRGYVGVNYTGYRWEQLTNNQKSTYSALFNFFKEKDLYPQWYDGLRLDSARKSSSMVKSAYGMAKITNVRTNKKYSYLPYTSNIPLDQEITYTGDAMAAVKGEETYQTGFYGSYNAIKSYLNSGSLVKDPDYQQAIQNYNIYVRNVYTQMPDTGLEEVRREFGSKVGMSEEALGNAIRMYLAEHTTYSDETSRAPMGTDFVDFFLNTTKRGFCTHYATAATMMFRAAGVPARYVEGYLVFPEDFTEKKEVKSVSMKEVGGTGAQQSYVMDITDANAHAWVEYYVEGQGWVPFEVTPGYYQLTVAEKVPEPIPEPLPEPDDTTGDEIPDDPGEEEEDKDDNEPLLLVVKIAIGVVAGIAVIFLAILLVRLRRNHAGHKRTRAMSTADPKHNVIYAYRYLTKLLSFVGVEEYKQTPYLEYVALLKQKFSFVEEAEAAAAMDIYLRAGFSDSVITPEEAEQAVEFAKRFAMKLYTQMNRRKRFVYLYVKNLY